MAMVTVTCPACEGSGYADYAAVPCELCLGLKTIDVPERRPRLWDRLLWWRK